MSHTLRVLLVGDIVGAPGRKAFARIVPKWKQEGRVDFVVANAENAAAGRGITGPLADELYGAGADVLTLGDHAWDQRELLSYVDKQERLVRPANFPPGNPGRGCTTVQTPDGVRVSVIALVGRVFMNPNDCPFRCADELLKHRAALGEVILVDVHAEATSEKIVLGRYLDGRVSCVFGTHTHVQTSDETILKKGTAYITDLGMTGPKDSAIGRDLQTITERFISGMPAKFAIAEHQLALEGIIIEVDKNTGRAQSIKRVREFIE
jgi:metallophosphoesterase (TIGR00282 family)